MKWKTIWGEMCALGTMAVLNSHVPGHAKTLSNVAAILIQGSSAATQNCKSEGRGCCKIQRCASLAATKASFARARVTVIPNCRITISPGAPVPTLSLCRQKARVRHRALASAGDRTNGVPRPKSTVRGTCSPPACPGAAAQAAASGTGGGAKRFFTKRC